MHNKPRRGNACQQFCLHDSSQVQHHPRDRRAPPLASVCQAFDARKNHNQMHLFLLSSIDMIADDIKASVARDLLCQMMPNPTPEIAYIQYSSDADKYAQRAKEFYQMIGVAPVLRQIDLDRRFSKQSIADLARADILHIPGGNTFDLIRAIRLRGIADAIEDFIHSGRLTVAVSAGALILGPSIGSARFGDDSLNHYGNDAALGVVDFEVFPHWNELSHFKEPLMGYSATVSHPVRIINDHEAIYIDSRGIRTLGDTLVVHGGQISHC